MDSFFSLFDPSDSSQNKQTKKRNKQEPDPTKKKNEAPKGRRRGRKPQGKNETLPEESSFLCEPELSTELLVKDGSYIENYFEVSKRDDDSNTDLDKKTKRRNSGRKSRRKKNKVSPAKDLAPNTAWSQDDNTIDTTNWNNQSSIVKSNDDNIGKNVNDLRNKNNTNKNDANVKDDFFKERAVYNVIDKLEKVSLKDDMYLAGDFDTDELDNDMYYSSDDNVEESYDDSTSEPEDSEDEVYGSLPPEPRFGNVEYKLQLVSPCERRFQHLVTQLKWRLRSGGGSAVYVVGVRDCGALRGLRARALRSSLVTLRRMARALHAALAHVTARRVAPHRAVAEVYIRKLADTQQSEELRIAVMGANEAGKSTLIGVLTQGELDNGRGSARLNMFRHLHEVKSGRTSSLSHEILGFDVQGNVVNYGCSELMTAERIGERSAKLVSFLDLAGHTKYQRTTLHGLSGYSPHHAMVVISATAGITPITEEHLGLLLALDLPHFVVLSKCELAAPLALATLMLRLAALLAPAGKKPVLIKDENAAMNWAAPQKSILDSIDNKDRANEDDDDKLSPVAVFPVSCVRGAGLSALHAHLLALHPPQAPPRGHDDPEACEFQIDEIFRVGGSTGPVVGGLVARGALREGARLLMGPLPRGQFAPVAVRTVYRNRVRAGEARAGQSASLGLALLPAGQRASGADGARLKPPADEGEEGGAVPAPRNGMVLLAVPEPRARARPSFGGCPPGKCKSKLIRDVNVLEENLKNRKNVRRKNGNLLQDESECDLGKDVDSDHLVGVGEGEGDSEECSCCDRVPLEDPSDPRGCIFFQASIQVLRHATAISAGFQCTIHVGNVRQTAIIEGILSREGCLRAGSSGAVVFRFARCPEYLVRGRRLLLTAGLGTRAIGRITQVFPYVP